MVARKPDRRPNLPVLASRLEKARQGAGFSAFTYEEIATVLSTALPFDESVPANEHQALIWKASLEAGSQGPITEKSLRGAFHACQEAYLKAPTRRYVFVTTIGLSLRDAPRPTVFRVGRATISDTLPARYEDARASVESGIPASDRCPLGHKFIRQHVSARSEHEAEVLGSKEVDLVRAAWNFFLNMKTRARMILPIRDEPVNRILVGRCHTLHHEDGSLAFPGHWRRTREPLPLPSPSRSLLPGEWRGAVRFHRDTKERLKRHIYSDVLQKGLVRYVRALDVIDGEACFIKLWSLAEFLTGSENQNYDVTIQRIQFLFKDQELTGQVLKHIRLQRNAMVHDGEPLDNVDGVIWPLKYYIERLLRFHFAFGCKMGTFEEACRFLDLPPEGRVLQSRISMCRKALALRTGWAI